MDGINVFGGYDLDFDERDPSLYTSSVKGSSSPTVLASKIISETVFDGFEVLGPTITAAGGDSIAVWVEDSDSDFTFSNNEVVAGNGVNGVSGPDGGDGTDGSDGGDGVDGGFANCSSLPAGGLGGANACGTVTVDGGDGGGLLCPTDGADQLDGSSGQGPGGGTGGEGACDAGLFFDSTLGCVCSIDTCWDDGGDGKNGTRGADGTGGTGSLEGRVVR